MLKSRQRSMPFAILHSLVKDHRPQSLRGICAQPASVIRGCGSAAKNITQRLTTGPFLVESYFSPASARKGLTQCARRSYLYVLCPQSLLSLMLISLKMHDRCQCQQEFTGCVCLPISQPPPIPENFKSQRKILRYRSLRCIPRTTLRIFGDKSDTLNSQRIVATLKQQPTPQEKN